MNNPLIIIGAGGHGAEVLAYAHDLGLPVSGAFDDGRAVGNWLSTQVIGGIDELAAFCGSQPEVHYLTAFGSNALRQRTVDKINALGIVNLRPHTLVHGRAWTGLNVQIGEGTVLAPGSLATTSVRIGRHCILNVKASVAHDCVIGDYCNINPGATICGNVQLGEGVSIGAGATVIEKRRIGAWTIIGAGAVVTRDLPDNVTAAGVPARIIKHQGGAPFS